MRFISIDAARGVAVLLMVIFHFCFDLAMLDLANWDFYYSSFWLLARALIVTLFLALVGISFTLSYGQENFYKKYLKRQCYLLACLIVISVSTYIYSGDRFIFFGVLHFIFVASIINLFFVHFFYINLISGFIIILLGNSVSSHLFHPPLLKWIGFQVLKPETEDYVPLFPWYGVVLLGLFLGKLITKSTFLIHVDQHMVGLGSIRTSALLGKNSLLIYMVHQPVLIGMLSLYIRVST